MIVLYGSKMNDTKRLDGMIHQGVTWNSVAMALVSCQEPSTLKATETRGLSREVVDEETR